MQPSSHRSNGRRNIRRATLGTLLVIVGVISGAGIGLARLNHFAAAPPMSAAIPSIPFDTSEAFEATVQEWTQTAMEQTGLDEQVLQQNYDRWWPATLHQIERINTPIEAISVVVLGAIVTAAGLVLCGAAGWGLWVVLCPVGASLGLPGVLLRNGRGGRWTRMLYVASGVGMIWFGIEWLDAIGKTGTSDAKPPMQLAGFLLICFGFAAIFGVIVRLLYQPSPLQSLSVLGTSKAERSRSRKSSGKVSGKLSGNVDSTLVMPSSMLAAMGSPSTFTRRYLDPALSVSSRSEPIEQTAELTVDLEQKDFECPLIVEIMRPEGMSQSTVQVGCRSMVLAMTDCIDAAVHLRMVSVFDDGHMVISLSEGDHDLDKNIVTDAATVFVERVTSLRSLLSTHLKSIDKVGRKRDCGVVVIESSEWRDLLLASERVLADAACQHGLQKWDIAAACYGRFHHPCQPITSKVLSDNGVF